MRRKKDDAAGDEWDARHKPYAYRKRRLSEKSRQGLFLIHIQACASDASCAKRFRQRTFVNSIAAPHIVHHAAGWQE